MTQLEKLGKRNTTVIGDSMQYLSVTLHRTEVVKVLNGVVTLNSGGWKTDTTRNRMNQASNQFGLGYRVYQAKGVWYVLIANQVEPVLFENWMFFNVKGKVKKNVYLSASISE